MSAAVATGSGCIPRSATRAARNVDEADSAWLICDSVLASVSGARRFGPAFAVRSSVAARAAGRCAGATWDGRLGRCVN